LWVRLYKLLLGRLEALERGEGVRLVAKRVWGPNYLNLVKGRLSRAGIPIMETREGIYVCREDYGCAVKAILSRDGW
jgi:hypothetical protein